jgi:hypothetical protein
VSVFNRSTCSFSLEIVVKSSRFPSIPALSRKEFIVLRITEKSSSRSGSSSFFESVEKYRQRTGKAKGELCGGDYAAVMAGALKANGFDTRLIAMRRSYEDEFSDAKPVWGVRYVFIIQLRPARGKEQGCEDCASAVFRALKAAGFDIRSASAEQRYRGRGTAISSARRAFYEFHILIQPEQKEQMA